jgi:hypothetical protein
LSMKQVQRNKVASRQEINNYKLNVQNPRGVGDG